MDSTIAPHCGQSSLSPQHCAQTVMCRQGLTKILLTCMPHMEHILDLTNILRMTSMTSAGYLTLWNMKQPYLSSRPTLTSTPTTRKAPRRLFLSETVLTCWRMCSLVGAIISGLQHVRAPPSCLNCPNTTFYEPYGRQSSVTLSVSQRQSLIKGSFLSPIDLKGFLRKFLILVTLFLTTFLSMRVGEIVVSWVSKRLTLFCLSLICKQLGSFFLSKRYLEVCSPQISHDLSTLTLSLRMALHSSPANRFPSIIWKSFYVPLLF